MKAGQSMMMVIGEEGWETHQMASGESRRPSFLEPCHR